MPADTENPASGGRYCSRCGLYKPLDQFRRLRRGQERRHAECNGCRNVADRLRVDRKRRRHCSKLFTKIFRAKRVSNAQALANVMISTFGGNNRFGESLGRWLNEAAPGSAFLARVQLAALRIIELAQHRQQKQCEDQFSLEQAAADPDTCDCAVRIIAEALRHDSAAIRHLLRRHGWRIERTRSGRSNP